MAEPGRPRTYTDQRERERERRMGYLRLLRKSEGHPLHGTTTGYGYGCRCDRCIEAERAYRAKLNANPYRAMQFNMPAYRSIPCEADAAAIEAQAQKVVEEALELAEAAHKAEGSSRVLEEAWDVVQACETLLRAYGAERAYTARNGVIDKNRSRGYYGGRR